MKQNHVILLVLCIAACISCHTIQTDAKHNVLSLLAELNSANEAFFTLAPTEKNCDAWDVWLSNDRSEMLAIIKRLHHQKSTKSDLVKLKEIYAHFEMGWRESTHQPIWKCDEPNVKNGLIEVGAVFYAFEELIHSWSDNNYALSKRRAKKKIEQCIECYKHQQAIYYNANRSDECELIGFDSKRLEKCNQVLGHCSSYYADSIAPRYTYTLAGNDYHRFAMFDSILMPMSIRGFRAHIFDWKSDVMGDSCRIYFSDYCNAAYSNIFQANYAHIESAESTVLAWDLMEHWCGGKFPMDYLSKYHDDEYPHRLYSVFVSNGCDRFGAMSNFKLLTEQLDSTSRDEMFEIYRQDVNAISEKTTKEVSRLIDAYPLFRHYFENDSILYNKLNRVTKDEALLRRYATKYLHN